VFYVFLLNKPHQFFLDISVFALYSKDYLLKIGIIVKWRQIFLTITGTVLQEGSGFFDLI